MDISAFCGLGKLYQSGKVHLINQHGQRWCCSQSIQDGWSLFHVLTWKRWAGSTKDAVEELRNTANACKACLRLTETLQAQSLRRGGTDRTDTEKLAEDMSDHLDELCGLNCDDCNGQVKTDTCY